MRTVKRRSIIRVFLHVLFPLLLGGMVYILWRDLSLRMFGWFDIIGIKPFISVLRDPALSVSGFVPGWVLYSLPNALWTYSFCYLMYWVWMDESALWRSAFLFIPIFLSVGLELGQLIGVVPGTFCLTDMFLNLLAIAAVLFIFRKGGEKNNDEKNFV